MARPPDYAYLESPGEYLIVRLYYAKLPMMRHPSSAPVWLINKIEDIVERYGWYYHSDTVIRLGNHTGYFLIRFKKASTAIPLKLLALAGLVVLGGVVIYRIVVEVIEVIENKIKIDAIKKRDANAKEVYNKCVDQGYDPQYCANVVQQIFETEDIVKEMKETNGGVLKELKDILIIAIGGLILLEVVRRSA